MANYTGRLQEIEKSSFSFKKAIIFGWLIASGAVAMELIHFIWGK